MRRSIPRKLLLEPQLSLTTITTIKGNNNNINTLNIIITPVPIPGRGMEAKGHQQQPKTKGDRIID
jgi:hypothetical protein